MTVSRTRTLVQVAALVAICSLPLAAHTRVAQNSPLGLKTFSTPSHQGFAEANPLIAPGLAESLCHQGVRSRCSAKERDDESNLDYFGARYHSAALGRFTRPDPLDWLSWQNGNRESRQRFEAFISDPQGFNKYVYTRNNPLTFVDPDGEDFELAVHFEGDASDEEKERILSALRQYLTNLDIGNVVVRDAAVKSDDRRTWGQWVKDGFNPDFQSLTVDFSRASYADAPEYVFAGDMTGEGELANLRGSDPRQWSNVVAWRVLHETISHELNIGPDTDQLFGIDPSRKGTLIEGAYGIGRPGIPGLNPRDTKTLQDLLRPRVRRYAR